MSDTFEVRKLAEDEYAVYDEDGDFVCGDDTYAGALEVLAILAESGRWHLSMEVEPNDE